MTFQLMDTGAVNILISLLHSNSNQQKYVFILRKCQASLQELFCYIRLNIFLLFTIFTIHGTRSPSNLIKFSPIFVNRRANPWCYTQNQFNFFNFLAPHDLYSLRKNNYNSTSMYTAQISLQKKEKLYYGTGQ